MNKDNHKKLKDAIKHLPTPDLGNKDIKDLILRLILEVPEDEVDSGNAARSKVKLDALRLLTDINKQDSDSGIQQDLLDILETRDE